MALVQREDCPSRKNPAADSQDQQAGGRNPEVDSQDQQAGGRNPEADS